LCQKTWTPVGDPKWQRIGATRLTGSRFDVSAWAHFSASSSNQLPQLDVDYCQRLLLALNPGPDSPLPTPHYHHPFTPSKTQKLQACPLSVVSVRRALTPFVANARLWACTQKIL